jgi:hypothetical protein
MSGAIPPPQYAFMAWCSAKKHWVKFTFALTTASRPALGPTQPPTQWTPGTLCLGVKRRGRKADHSPPSSAEVRKCVNLYLHSPYTSSYWNSVFFIRTLHSSLDVMREAETFSVILVTYVIGNGLDGQRSNSGGCFGPWLTILSTRY